LACEKPSLATSLPVKGRQRAADPERIAIEIFDVPVDTVRPILAFAAVPSPITDPMREHDEPPLDFDVGALEIVIGISNAVDQLAALAERTRRRGLHTKPTPSWVSCAGSIALLN
jgi:hypothetical protein